MPYRSLPKDLAQADLSFFDHLRCNKLGWPKYQTTPKPWMMRGGMTDQDVLWECWSAKCERCGKSIAMKDWFAQASFSDLKQWRLRTRYAMEHYQ